MQILEKSQNIDSYLKLALEQRKQKNWVEAQALYELIAMAYNEECTVNTFIGLAICYRKNKLYEKSREVLSFSQSKFKSINLTIELAALENDLKNWEDAYSLWCIVRKDKKKWTALNKKRHAMSLHALVIGICDDASIENIDAKLSKIIGKIDDRDVHVFLREIYLNFCSKKEIKLAYKFKCSAALKVLERYKENKKNSNTMNILAASAGFYLEDFDFTTRFDSSLFPGFHYMYFLSKCLLAGGGF